MKEVIWLEMDCKLLDKLLEEAAAQEDFVTPTTSLNFWIFLPPANPGLYWTDFYE